MKSFRLLLLILSLSIENPVYSQNTDSIHLISSYPFNSYSPLNQDSLAEFHNDQFPADQAPLGTTGLPAINLFYKGFSFNPLDASLFDTTLAPVFHKSSIPYSSVKYFVSSLKSQALNLNHVQPLYQSAYAGVTYKNFRTEGEFQNQQVKYDWVNLHLNWTPGKYKSSLYGIFSQLNRQENGGIRDDSIFLERVYRSELFPVHLSPGAASYKRNWLTGLYQEINILDSTTHISNRSTYVYKVFEYQDTTSGYYGNYFFDTFSTLDKTERISYTNETGFNFQKKLLKIALFYQADLINYKSYLADTSTLNHSARAEFFSEFKAHKFAFNVKYFFAGFNQNDYTVNFNWKYDITRDITGGLRINSFSNKPFINYFKYYSNNFIWNNKLYNIVQNNIRAFLSIEKLQLDAELGVLLISNPVGIDSTFEMLQDTQSSSAFQFRINKNFKLSRLINWKTELFLQKLSGSELIRGPELILKSSVFLSGKAWTAKYNLGIDGWYYSSWLAPVWIPSLNDFALQNSLKTGNYIVLDLFFEAKIQSVRLYLVGANVSDGFTGKNTFVSNGYPFPGRSVRIGVQWDFKN